MMSIFDKGIDSDRWQKVNVRTDTEIENPDKFDYS